VYSYLTVKIFAAPPHRRHIVFRYRFGFPPGPTRERPPLFPALRPRPRTLVIPSCPAPFYRFFLPPTPNSPHGCSYSTPQQAGCSNSNRAWDSALEAGVSLSPTRLYSRSRRLVLAGLGGHFWRATQSAAGGMLLRLRRGPCPRRLRQDVRAKEVRFAMVGHYLR